MLLNRSIRRFKHGRVVSDIVNITPVIDPAFLKDSIPELKQLSVKLPTECVIPDKLAEKIYDLYDSPAIADNVISDNSTSGTAQIPLSAFLHVRHKLIELVRAGLEALPAGIYSSVKNEVQKQADAEATERCGYAVTLTNGKRVVIDPDCLSPVYEFGAESGIGNASQYAEIKNNEPLKVIWPTNATVTRLEIRGTRYPLVLITDDLDLNKLCDEEKIAKHNRNVRDKKFNSKMRDRLEKELHHVVLTSENIIKALQRVYMPQEEKESDSVFDKLAESSLSSVSQTTACVSGTRFAGTYAGTKRKFRKNKNKEPDKEWSLLEAAPFKEYRTGPFHAPGDLYDTFASCSLIRQGDRVFYGLKEKGDIPTFRHPLFKHNNWSYEVAYSYNAISNNYYFFNRPRLAKYAGFEAPFIGMLSDSRLPEILTAVGNMGDVLRHLSTSYDLENDGRLMEEIRKNLTAKDKWVLSQKLPFVGANYSYDPRNTEGNRIAEDDSYAKIVLRARKNLFDADVAKLHFIPYIDVPLEDILSDRQDPWSLEYKLAMLAYIDELLGSDGIAEVIETGVIDIDGLFNKLKLYGWTNEDDGVKRYTGREAIEVPEELAAEYSPDIEKCEVFSIDSVSQEQIDEIANIEDNEEREKRLFELIKTDNINRMMSKDFFFRRNMCERRVPLLQPDKVGLEAMGVETLQDPVKYEEHVGEKILTKIRRRGDRSFNFPLSSSAKIADREGHPENDWILEENDKDYTAHTGVEGYTADLPDSFAYWDAIRFNNTVKRDKEDTGAER